MKPIQPIKLSFLLARFRLTIVVYVDRNRRKSAEEVRYASGKILEPDLRDPSPGEIKRAAVQEIQEDLCLGL
jgi:hypothetical protein